MDENSPQLKTNFKISSDFTSQWNQIDLKDGFYLTVNLVDILPQTATNYGMFFTARWPMEVLFVSEIHGVAGTNGGAVTLDIEKLTGTTAKGSGTSILASTFNLKSTANTVVSKEGVNLSAARTLVQGDRLALKSSGTLTTLSDLQVTLYCKMLGRGGYR